MPSTFENESSETIEESGSVEAPSANNRLYSMTAPMYDRINLSVSFGNGYRYREEEVRKLCISEGDHLLDIGSGTGILAKTALELAGTNGRVVALDPCLEMLKIAERSGITETMIGSIDEIPVEDETFDFVTSGYSLRYAKDITHGLGEIWRVLKPGGKALILEVTPPKNAALRLLTRTYILVGARIIAMMATRSLTSQKLLGHLWNEIRTTPQPESFLKSLESIGFRDCSCQRKHGMLTAYTAIKPLGSSINDPLT